VISQYLISRTVTPAASLALVTLDQAKLALGITDTSQDAALTAQINQVSAAINRYCDRIFVQQGYRDQFRYVLNWMPVGQPLPLRQYPLAVDEDGNPLATVVEDSVAVDAAAFEADADRGYLYRLDGAAYAWTGLLITVDYTAGYDPIPDDLQWATLEWLGVQWHSGYGRDPSLRAETIPDLITQTWDTSAAAVGASTTTVPAAVRGILWPYMRPAL
jgi:hypothetical protein